MHDYIVMERIAGLFTALLASKTVRPCADQGGA
jgi:hypothetical protein